MQPNEITEVLNRPISQELLARDVTRFGLRRQRRHIPQCPDHLYIDFETTLPSAVEELVRQREELRRG
ncbi:hypothetical protein OG589_12505 [Sphaerisporangium sp. NBC_01403]|uniref:hypothetical protein n=1 Tax=Sphaerisporangium sp. NBC_01403 TaxID=2903599 RepID=UPI00324532FD